MAIKSIFFDFWGTIVENGVFPSPIRQVKNILGLQEEFSEYVQRFEKAFMLTKFEDLYAAFTEVCKEFKIEPKQEILDQLVGLWNRNKLFAKPYIETKTILDRFGTDYKLYLISNTDCFSVPEVIQKYDLTGAFESILLSFQEGALKTDEKMWNVAIKKAGCEPAEILMVGDSLESDMSPAEKAGVHTVLVDRRDRREYASKIKSLNYLGAHVKTL